MVSRGAWGSAWGNSKGAAQAQLPATAAPDFAVTSPPADGVTSLHFAPSRQPCLLLASSWDQQLRIWEIAGQGSTVPKAAVQLEAPALCSAWSPDGSAAFAGGCDNKAHLWNLQTNQLQQVSAHQEAVRQMHFIIESNLLLTASWDRTIKYWDLRQQQATHSIDLPERVYASSLQHPLLVLGLANRMIQAYDLKNPMQPFKECFSMLKFQTRCIACYPAPSPRGFVLGNMEGRVACNWLDPPHKDKTFSFKCHRNQQGIHAVNSIVFHPVTGTFATAGSDGTVSFWDKDAKQRLKGLPSFGQPITCADFSSDGALYACAACYDWSRGSAGHTGGSKVIVHPVGQGDVQPKPPQQRR